MGVGYRDYYGVRSCSAALPHAQSNQLSCSLYALAVSLPTAHADILRACFEFPADTTALWLGIIKASFIETRFKVVATSIFTALVTQQNLGNSAQCFFRVSSFAMIHFAGSGIYLEIIYVSLSGNKIAGTNKDRDKNLIPCLENI
ncbi:hypothetical protein KQX54_007055 [Cotesia glomerata]|uniref:Olfactory receptor n=1 Tax=Cotesia glomerata TaxID=32391 RepID=A0AAV7I4C4_COTGL|nr:hypothetical protein KQX54_007055 [Cotesia glomerata]